MKRRTIDLMFSIGGATLAVLLLFGGIVMTGNASFSKNYVHDQLSAQKMTFKAADKLTDAEKAYTNTRTGCLMKYAGQQVTTGKQAECWANEYMAGHMEDPLKYPAAAGKSYAELGAVQADLRTKITAATGGKDPALAGLEQQLADVTSARDTMFKGEMQRGVLLTSFGFSVLGEKAGQVATIAFIAAGLLALLSIAGLVHAMRTPPTKAFGLPEGIDLSGTARAELKV